MEVVVTTGAVSHAKLQSNHHHEQTNIQFFTGRMSFLLPNQQCQRSEWELVVELRYTVYTSRLGCLDTVCWVTWRTSGVQKNSHKQTLMVLIATSHCTLCRRKKVGHFIFLL